MISPKQNKTKQLNKRKKKKKIKNKYCKTNTETIVLTVLGITASYYTFSLGSLY
jgi:hypothetical protein